MNENLSNSSQGGFNDQTVFEPPTTGVPWRILLFSMVLFGLSLLVFFGLRFGYLAYLNSQSESLDAKLTELADRVGQDEQQDFTIFYSQLVNLKKILEGHAFSMNMLKFMEKYTLPPVFFTKASLYAEKRELELEGEANSIDTLIEQLAVFDDAVELSEKAVIKTIIINPAGKAGFTIALHFKKDFLSRP